MAKKISFKDSVMLNPLGRTRGTGETKRSGQLQHGWTTHTTPIIEKHMTGTTGARGLSPNVSRHGAQMSQTSMKSV